MSDITAIVLTKNEAANLGRCFASLRWCQEIVVVDSGSTDGTQDEAIRLGARVLDHVQPPPFRISEQRNWVLREGSVKTPWALFIDADEVVPDKLAAVLEQEVKRADYDAFELTPRYIFWGKWLKRTQGYPNWHARLVRVGGAVFEGGVWEHFSPGTNVGRIHIPYDHYANSKGFSDWFERHDRYSSWDAEKIASYLESGDADAFGTSRKLGLRKMAAKFWPLRPWARFAQMYFLRLGFLEGKAAFTFCLLYFFYEWMVVVKVAERLRIKRGLPL